MSKATIYSIGIDIGGTNTKAVALSATGEVLVDRHLPTPRDREPLIDVVRRLLADLDAGAAPVGISSPGLAARGNRSIQWMRGRMQCVEGLDWTTRLQRPIAVLNDAHAATLGEAWRGAAVGKRHVILLTLGTGVGGGVLLDGRLLQGAIGRAGHLGHLCLDLAGPQDIVNTPGSLEDLIGNHTIGARTGGRFKSTTDLVKAFTQNDPFATGVWMKSIRALACGVVSLINAFDPEVIVLGGGIALSGAALFDPLRAELDRLEWRPLGAAVPIVPATLGDVAGAIGAGHFAATRALQGDVSK